LLSDDDLVFALAVFARFFFSSVASVCSPLDFGRFDFACADELDAFAKTVFFGGGLRAGFGVGFVFASVAAVFETGVGVAFDSGVGKSISLFA
jgi:hypothetical protein